MSETPKKIAFHNLGCKVNAYETDAMIEAFLEKGFVLVPFDEVADVYIVNTCSVTNIADRKSRQMIHRAKKHNKDAFVVAVGCYVQAAKDALKDDDSIDLAIGNNHKGQIVSMVLDAYEEKKKTKSDKPVLSIPEIGEEKSFDSQFLTRIESHTRAFIKVQDGCNQFCSYCIIPYVRGRIRSRDIDDVEKEVRVLLEKGISELVLTGIHLGSYGMDDPKTGKDLKSLIVRLAKLEGVKRIRLGSLEPRSITEDFVKTLSELKNVCPHFHLSLQSGCDETLKRMNRKYTTSEYETACNLLRKYFDDPAITTDVIVGFPGETKEEFETTYAYLKKVSLYEMHIFKYSVRKGTVAANMPNQVAESIKTKRSECLFELEHKLSLSYREKACKKESLQVLFEEKVTIDNKKYLVGYTKNYVRVAVAVEEENNLNLENTICDVAPVSMLNDEIVLAKMIAK